MRSLLLTSLVAACYTAPATRPPPKQPPPPPPTEAKPAPAERESPGMTDEDAARFAELLTVEDPSPSAGDMARRPSGSDLRRQIEEVKRGQQIYVGGTARGDGSKGIGRVGPPIDKLAGPDVSQPPPSGPSGRITVGNTTAFDKTTLTREMVLAKIEAAYMAYVKRCYKSYLNKDETAGGRVALRFVVTEAGRVTSATASGFSKEVDACIAGYMAGWLFPVPKDGAGDKTEASFDITLQLAPD